MCSSVGGGRESPRFRVPVTRFTSGTQTSIPYCKAGWMTKWMMRSSQPVPVSLFISVVTQV
jgi:hypothetical protein